MARAVRTNLTARVAAALFALVVSTVLVVAVTGTPAHAKYGAMVHPTSGVVIKKIYRNCNGTTSQHAAIDIRNSPFTKVYAAYDGKVVNISTNRQGGLIVDIRHPSGYKTRYARMLADHTKVYEGKVVYRGQFIGFMGDRGHNDGRSFLHFQVLRYGEVFTSLNKGYRCGASVTAREPIQVDFPGL